MNWGPINDQLQREYSQRVIKALSKVESSGYWPYQIFTDWLEIVEPTIARLPHHARSLFETGQMAPDPPEVQEVFERIYSRYKEPYREQFAEALAILLEGSDLAIMDILGWTYMNYCSGKGWVGQYFTPANIVNAMSMMIVMDGESEIQDRLKQARTKLVEAGDPGEEALLMATTLAGLVIRDPDESRHYFISRILPIVWPYFEPITVCDPAVGSGIMLLGAAGQYPRWAVELGLVQFYGADIDIVCVRMAKINAMLYGLNGIGIQWAQTMGEEMLRALPDYFEALYRDAREAHEAGDLDRLKEITVEIREYRQAPLMDLSGIPAVEPSQPEKKDGKMTIAKPKIEQPQLFET